MTARVFVDRNVLVYARDASVPEKLAWEPLPIDARVLDGAWRLQDRHALSWWDALIVAAAETLECSHLLSEDLQSGQQLGAVTVVDPFQTAPAQLAT